MNLNERKIRILQAIINDYIATGDPIGSRTIAKKYNLGISSATIRNEMSDLEELGLIVQPHTSAGRVPSDKGYRLYVDRLMNCRELTSEETAFLNQLVASNIEHIDYLMQQTAKALSALTSYTTIVSEPKEWKIDIKHIQLVPLDEKSFVAVVVTDNKSVKNYVVRVEEAPELEELNKISAVINSLLKSNNAAAIKESLENATLSIQLGQYGDIIELIFKEIFKTADKQEEMQLYTSGVNNILEFPEFSDIEKAKIIFKTLEQKDMLVKILADISDDDTVQILIGNENNMEQLRDCSIIRAKYRVGSAVGAIGVIGPTRMNYSQTISVLNGIVTNINDVIKTLMGG